MTGTSKYGFIAFHHGNIKFSVFEFGYLILILILFLSLSLSLLLSCLLSLSISNIHIRARAACCKHMIVLEGVLDTIDVNANVYV
jgi:hypothetical protein